MFIYPDLIDFMPSKLDLMMMMMMIVSLCTLSQREICQANLGDLSDLKY